MSFKFSYYQYAIDEANKEVEALKEEKKVSMSNLKQFIHEYG
jgi:hypothetical protein